MNTTLTFNGPASEMIQSAGGHKVRLGMMLSPNDKHHVLRLRPTDRKDGLCTLIVQKRTGTPSAISIEIDDSLKCCRDLEIPRPGSKYELVKDRYGWFVLFPVMDQPTSMDGNLVNVNTTRVHAPRG